MHSDFATDQRRTTRYMLFRDDHTDLKPNESFELQRCPEPLIEDLYRTRTIPLGDGSLRPMEVYIPREQGDLLYSIVRYLRPEKTVEVGMANGLSSLFIASALKDNGRGEHVAIDPFQNSDWGGAGLCLLRRAGLDSLVRLVEKPSHQGLPQLEQEGVRAQFVFIDGSHLFDYVMTDFLCSDRILDVGGMMALDDSDSESVAKAIRFVLTNRSYSVAFPQIVIEDPCYHPTVMGSLLRWTGRAVPGLGRKLRPEFLVPAYTMGVRGRCVVLQKRAVDDRHHQAKTLGEF